MTGLFALAEARGRPWLANMDPRVKLAWIVWASVVSILLDSTYGLVSLVLWAASGVVGLTMQPKGWLIIALLLASVVWGTLFSQAIFYAGAPRTTLWILIPEIDIGWFGHFPGLRVYREGVQHGMAQSLRMLAVMLTGMTVCLSTSPEKLMAALVRLRLPVAVGFMTVAALRFLPILLQEIALVRQARRLRGYRRLRPARGRLRALFSELSLLRPVLSITLRRAESLATSVASRGFDPNAPRTFYPELCYTKMELVGLFALGVSVGTVLVVKGLYWLYLADFFYHPSLRNTYDLARSWF